MTCLVKYRMKDIPNWSLWIDKGFHPTLCNKCNYLSMLRLMLNMWVKGVSGSRAVHALAPGLYYCKMHLCVCDRGVETRVAALVTLWLYCMISWLMETQPDALMMTSSNGNIFRATGVLCGEFTGPRWILRTKASDAGLWCWSAPEYTVE